jgi:hypothetical protein
MEPTGRIRRSAPASNRRPPVKSVSAFYNAMTEPGCEVVAFEEVGDAVEAWQVPPLAGLPQILLMASRKQLLYCA